MKRSPMLMLISLFIICLSCGTDQNNESEVISTDNASSEQTVVKYVAPVVVDSVKTNVESLTPVQDGNSFPISKKNIIKDGTISVKTKDLSASKKAIDHLVKSKKAYYMTEEFSTDDHSISYNLKIRIPTENFENFLSGIENGNDEIINKNIQARDVTEEFTDIETRLTTKREYLKRYRELLSTAKTVKDILEIEGNIRSIQEEVDSRQGRLNYLSDQVAYSTLDVYLFKEKEYLYKPHEQSKFSERVKNSLSKGWNSIVNFVIGTISAWPQILLILMSLLIIRWAIRKRKINQIK